MKPLCPPWSPSVLLFLFLLVQALPGQTQEDAPTAEELHQQAAAAVSDRNLVEGRRLFALAAEKGHQPSALRLASMLMMGIGGPSDRERARALYLAAAEQGDRRAMLDLARALFQGHGGPRDPVGAISWAEKAFEAGDNYAALVLGGFFETPEDSSRDLEQALAWYRRGAESGGSTARAAVNRLEFAARRTPAEKLSSYERAFSQVRPGPNQSRDRGQAFWNYYRALYDAGVSATEAATTARPALRKLAEEDFYAVHHALSYTAVPLRPALRAQLEPDQRIVLERIVARNANRSARDPEIQPGQGWSAAFPEGKRPSGLAPAPSASSAVATKSTTPASSSSATSAAPRLSSAAAKATTWDELFAAVAAERSRFTAIADGQAFAAKVPASPEEIRDAYRRALTRHRPTPNDKRGALIGRLFGAYHEAVLARGLSPQAAANFCREDFQNLARADIHNAFEAIPTGQHLALFRSFLTSQQNDQVRQIAQGTAQRQTSPGTAAPTPIAQQTAATGFQKFQEHSGNFRRNLPGHWIMNAKMIGDGRTQPMEIRFGGPGDTVTTMTANPLNSGSSTHSAQIQETKDTLTGGSWFKVIFHYNNMRFEGQRPRTGGLEGGIYDQQNRHIGTWNAAKRLDLDYAALAVQARRAGNTEAALHYYGEAIRHGRRAGHYIARAGLHYDAKNHTAAIADLTDALKLEAGNTTARYNRMLAHYYARQHEAALADADHLLARKPPPLAPAEIALVHQSRGDILWWLERREESEQAYAAAVALDPKLQDRVRVANTREGRLSEMAKSSAEVNRIMSKLSDGLAKSTAELRQATEAMQAVSDSARTQATTLADTPVDDEPPHLPAR